MASTQLTDLIVPDIFSAYVLEQSTVKNALINSGIVIPNPAIVEKLSGGGVTFKVPTIANIANGSGTPNVSSDDPADVAVTKKLSAYEQIAVRTERNDSWSSADLTAAIAGTDPLAALAASLGGYVAKWRQKSLLSTIAGCINETNAATSVNTIASETVADQSASTKISASAVIDTATAWGDLGAEGVVVMHSDTYRALQKANLITYVATSAQDLRFGTYLGYSVLVDDTAPKRAGSTDGLVYTTYFIKQGAVQYGIGPVKNQTWVQRYELQGNGGGVETVGFRDAFAFHVDGFKFTSASVAKTIPTDAELATAANWLMVAPAKSVGITALVHNV